MRFPGQFEDPESGSYYNYHRDYDPATGRYSEADPRGLQSGLNTYAYVINNPLVLFDLYGLLACSYFIDEHTMYCANDSGETRRITSIVSGIGECENNSKCIRRSFKGPIKPGKYTIYSASQTRHAGDWMYLEPDDKNDMSAIDSDDPRGGFFFHPFVTKSTGCIAFLIIDEFNLIKKWAEEDKGGVLRVSK